jgi:hypothetical protein
MASEIRVNKIINRSGLSTVTFSDTGAIVSGIVTANSFSGNVTGAVTGSGANLTSIPAGQLTGTLPAISGANLTSLPAQATIANNADNRVITGGSGVNLNGESTLTHNGGVLSVNEPSLGTDAKLIIKGNDSNNHDIITAYANSSTRGSFAIRTGTSISPSFLIGTRGGSETFALMTNGAERLRVTDNGLTFNGDSAAANALDDYEQGNWTPDWRGGSALGTTSYGSYNSASYVKIGNQVTVRGFSTITGSSGGSGFWFINNLPFTCGGGDDRRFRSVGSVMIENFNFNSDVSDVVCFIERNNNDMQLRSNRDNAGAGANISVNNDTSFEIMFTITYQTV